MHQRPNQRARPSPRKHSLEVTTCTKYSNIHPIIAYCSFIDLKRSSWPGWLTCSGWFTHNSSHPSAAGRALFCKCGFVQNGLPLWLLIALQVSLTFDLGTRLTIQRKQAIGGKLHLTQKQAVYEACAYEQARKSKRKLTSLSLYDHYSCFNE